MPRTAFFRSLRLIISGAAHDQRTEIRRLQIIFAEEKSEDREAKKSAAKKHEKAVQTLNGAKLAHAEYWTGRRSGSRCDLEYFS